MGFGYVQTLVKDTARIGIDAPPPPAGPGPSEIDLPPISIDTKQISAYLYTYINLLRNVTFTLGGSFEYVDASEDLIRGVGATSSTQSSGLHGRHYQIRLFVVRSLGH